MSDLHHHFLLRSITTRTLNDRMQNYPILRADPSKSHRKASSVECRHLSSCEVVRVEQQTRVFADRSRVKIVSPPPIHSLSRHNGVWYVAASLLAR